MFKKLTLVFLLTLALPMAAGAARGNRNLVLEFQGPAQDPSEAEIDQLILLFLDAGVSGPVTANDCLKTDMLVDLKNGMDIGSAFDCSTGVPNVDGLLDIVWVFNLPGGTVVAQALGVGLGVPGFLQALTGTVPLVADDAVIHGTGQFQNASGSVRLSGAVTFDADPPSPFKFHCIFILDLSLQRLRSR